MGNSESTARDFADLKLSWPVGQPSLRYYYTIVLALMRGSKQNRRPRLPPELVIVICRYFDIHRVSTELAVVENRRASVIAFNGSETVSKKWMQIPLPPARILNRIQSFQLSTYSKPEGFNNLVQGYWSWFEVGVCRKDENLGKLVPKTKSNGTPAYWVSHTHPLDDEYEEDVNEEPEDDNDAEGEADEIGEEQDLNEAEGDDEDEFHFSNCQLHQGVRFGPDHPIWDQVEEGDVLVVELNARYPGSANYACKGVIRVDAWWEPSATMLELARSR
ncbi:hypothetical protein FRC12_014098 [Ceratobasidium sp. 428]|nr:hypothetical protein FRC12_014098 [Ceratobasidium sp. 428]